MTEHILSLAPFTIKLSTNCDLVSKSVKLLYEDALVPSSDEIYDYQVAVSKPLGVRALFKPQSVFSCDQQDIFNPLPYNHAFASLEWGMNWVVSAHEFQYVIIHSAILEKNGKAVVFPAPPGSGKSTLTAYLAFNGWRLLSDEMALIIPHSNKVQPFVRPICLKNQSIALAKSWFPQGRFSTTATNTHKGDVVHLSPPKDSWKKSNIPASISAIIFPKYEKGSEVVVEELNQASAFMELASNAFNFAILGETGFKTLTKVVEQSYCAKINYSNLNDVLDYLDECVL